MIARALAWGACAVALGACTLRVPGADRSFFGAREVAEPRAEDCERCHQEVYREWRDSAHARAWTSEAFQAASAHGAAGECASCHAAAPVDADAPVSLRAENREEGVTCTTCHLAPDAAPLTMRGPVSRTSPIEIHPIIEADPLYRSSELCGTCHVGELAEWDDAVWSGDGEKPTCQGCHMPQVHRKVESVHDEHGYSALFVALNRAQDLRRHLFAVPEDATEQIDVEARVRDGVVEVRITNRIPHALPTGRFGRRELAVRATWPGGSAQTGFARARSGALGAGESRSVELALPEAARAAPIEVEVMRWDRAGEDWISLARRELPGADG